MQNKIELLRSICFTAEDLENITNLGDTFTELDISFIVEFKKIYELGTLQLYKFIDKLDIEGKDLDVYSILYYTKILLNGPLGNYVREYAKDKRYFSDFADSIGVLGNFARTTSNSPYVQNEKFPLGSSVETFNKLPDYMQASISLVKMNEEIFNSSLKSSIINDNTLPLSDKKPQDRYNQELSGKWGSLANASYLLQDVSFVNSIESISSNIFNSIKKQIGEENYRLFEYNKTYTPFDSDKNTSVGLNVSLEKKYSDSNSEDIIRVDIFGEPIDSEEKRNTVLKVFSEEKDLEYKLNTVEGQLGT
jgi:hypothetical protein